MEFPTERPEHARVAHCELGFGELARSLARSPMRIAFQMHTPESPDP